MSHQVFLLHFLLAKKWRVLLAFFLKKATFMPTSIFEFREGDIYLFPLIILHSLLYLFILLLYLFLFFMTKISNQKGCSPLSHLTKFIKIIMIKNCIFFFGFWLMLRHQLLFGFEPFFFCGGSGSRTFPHSPRKKRKLNGIPLPQRRRRKTEAYVNSPVTNFVTNCLGRNFMMFIFCCGMNHQFFGSHLSFFLVFCFY